MAEGAAKRPFLVGLTGSIGMGKTETGKLFARLGLPVYDADSVVHELYEKAGAGSEAIAKAFPDVVKNGRVDRERLAAAVGGDENAFKKLESIIHPLVRQAEKRFISAAAQRGEELVILDIPLLYETRGAGRMDAVVVVSAPEEVRRERVLSRPGMSLKKLEQISARQVPDAEKRAQADYVIETGKGLEHAFEEVKRVAADLRQRAASKMRS